jgi:hypothetical protein
MSTLELSIYTKIAELEYLLESLTAESAIGSVVAEINDLHQALLELKDI